MNIFKRHRVNDVPIKVRHIHSLHIRAFATEGFDFTLEESAHFDVCRVCRLKVIDALRNGAPLVLPTIMQKAA
jgi:hypothetical protein